MLVTLITLNYRFSHSLVNFLFDDWQQLTHDHAPVGDIFLCEMKRPDYFF